MKLHLPIIVLTALLGTFVAHAVDIPSDYEQITLSSSSDLNNYTSNTEDDKYAFFISTDVSYTPTTNPSWTSTSPLVSGGNLIFTSSEGYVPVALSFKGGQSTVFDLPNNLSFDTFSNLTVSCQSESSNGNAINLGTNGKLYIRNVKDGTRDTPDVLFSNSSSNKKHSAQGSAISASGSSSLVDILDNGDLYISDNSVNSVSYQNNSSLACGGSLYLEGICNISYNGDVYISDNASSSAATDYFSKYTDSESHGGAMYSKGIFNISNNEDVDIRGNSALSSSYRAPNSYNAYNSFYSNSTGGAIYSTESISICNNNGNVSIVGNSAFSNAAYKYNESVSVSRGGAIGSTGSIDISNNKDVFFSGNSANSAAQLPGVTTTGTRHAHDDRSYGGAIYSTDSLCINNNEDVLFSGNSVISIGYSNPLYSSNGGAIYSTGSIALVGNDSVIFENNYEKLKDSYRLRSMYIAPDNAADTLKIAAKSGGHITFYDSVYMGNYSGVEVSLNADYQDAQGVTRKATGDIVFSGKFTEDHLKEIKGGTAGTATEIANSRTSELLNTINLYGGKLRVEEKAVLKTHDIKVAEGSKATVKVANAELNASGYDITVNKTGTLLLEGSMVDAAVQKALVCAKNISIANGAELAVACVTTNSGETTASAAFTLNTSTSTGYDASRAFNILAGGEIDADLLTIAEGAKLTAQGAHIGMNSGVLTLNVTSTATKRIELNLTLSAAYDPAAQVVLFSDVATVNFIRDGIAAKSTDGTVYTLNADDYFSGAWITDTTTLVYDAANKVVYLEGVANAPEPTSSMLGLMGLVAFVLRRRRK